MRTLFWMSITWNYVHVDVSRLASLGKTFESVHVIFLITKSFQTCDWTCFVFTLFKTKAYGFQATVSDLIFWKLFLLSTLTLSLFSFSFSEEKHENVLSNFL